MKKLAIVIALIVGTSGIANAKMSKSSQNKLSSVLYDVGLTHQWQSDISLWIEAPYGFTKFDMEKMSNIMCAKTRGHGTYGITWWHSLGYGKITRKFCGS